jgi:hypothetical protein
MGTPAEDAERAAHAYAEQAWASVGFVMHSSVWAPRFSDEERRAAESVRDALYRELERPPTAPSLPAAS